MGQNRQWILIDEAITAYMDEAELSNHKYFKLWHIAFRGLTELGLDAFYCVRSVKLPVNSNLTVTLPADYLNYSNNHKQQHLHMKLANIILILNFHLNKH